MATTEVKKPSPNTEDVAAAIVAVLEGHSDDPELDVAKVVMETLPEKLSEDQKRRIAATATAMVMGGEI